MKHAGISIVLLLACQSAQASAQVLEFSAGASAVVDQLKISNQRFRPVVASLEMALNHRENGIGLELHLGRGISEDDAVGVDIDVLQQHSLYVTFTNTYQGKYRVWLGAGYSLLELDSRNASGFPGKQDFESTSFALTAQEYSFAAIPNLSLTGSFRHLFKDDNLTVQALSLGLRYDF